MKTGKTIHEMSNAINANPLEITNRQLFKFFSLPIWVAYCHEHQPWLCYPNCKS